MGKVVLGMEENIFIDQNFWKTSSLKMRKMTSIAEVREQVLQVAFFIDRFFLTLQVPTHLISP